MRLFAAALLALSLAWAIPPGQARADDADNPDASGQSDTDKPDTDSGDAFSQGGATKDEDSGAAQNAAPVAIADFASAVKALNADDGDVKAKAVEYLGKTGEARAIPVLKAMANDQLFVAKDGALVYLIGDKYFDALTGKEVAGLKSGDLAEVSANNRLRGQIQGTVGQLGLFAPDASTRRQAAADIAGQPTPEGAAMLRQALDKETDAGVKSAIANALAGFDLADPDPAKRMAAIDRFADSNDPNAAGMLKRLLDTEKDPKVKAAAEKAYSSIRFRVGLIGIGVNLFEGLSLGSILLLAAIGLSVTFGVMGVINMAHGEMIMLGAYTAYVTQRVFAAWLPYGMMDFYLPVAVPVAFIFTAAVGMLLERTVIRFLYGRPLETLLSTWGISLMLQQAVRSIFGPDNQAVANPSWMSGGMDLAGGFTLTWNRLVIIFFCLAVLGALAAVLRYSAFGLHMRAVSQNRPMASAMGIRTGRVDAMTFAVGSGIAGTAGVALSQIGNVSPNLGQIYIVDSFMVVVFGGVGSLWGTLLGAGTLGIVNKLLEPFAGAILGKVLVLVLIILFIQRRPRGLFALKGRSAEG
jgi:urea transport system permease protein